MEETRGRGAQAEGYVPPNPHRNPRRARTPHLGLFGNLTMPTSLLGGHAKNPPPRGDYDETTTFLLCIPRPIVTFFFGLRPATRPFTIPSFPGPLSLAPPGTDYREFCPSSGFRKAQTPPLPSAAAAFVRAAEVNTASARGHVHHGDQPADLRRQRRFAAHVSEIPRLLS